MLQESEEEFLEVLSLVESYKCFLLNEDDEFLYKGNVVEIKENGQDHYLYFQDYYLRLWIIDKEVYDYEFYK